MKRAAATTPITDSLNDLARRATEGEKWALNQLVQEIQKEIYPLAARLLRNRTELEDAVQEVLIKIVTRLSTFRQESAFSTWVFRVTWNHLLSLRKQRAGENRRIVRQLDSPEEREPFAHGVVDDGPSPDEALLQRETRRCWAKALRKSLDPEQRRALMLGAIRGLNSQEAARELNIATSTFRKRLSRANQRVVHYLNDQCGLINSGNRCRCNGLPGEKVAGPFGEDEDWLHEQFNAERKGAPAEPQRDGEGRSSAFIKPSRRNEKNHETR